MQILKNIELRKEVISEVKFSPNKNYLAVGSHDNKIDVYTVHDMQKKCTLDSSTSFITALDWSENSDSIRTNDASYEILYYNVESKKQDPSGATNFRDEQWSTYTCMLGWAS